MVFLVEQKLFEARFWEKLKDKKVKCNACNRHCVISENNTGVCGVRKNLNGKLFSLVYGKTLTLTVDPIEKKPLFHFKPGTDCVGVSTFGCNFKCLHCQNFHISQQFSEEKIERVQFLSPTEIVEKTLELGVPGIAYTYTEPTVFIEYALDTMKEAKKFGLYNVFVSNGYMTKEVLEASKGLLDAINVDLKGNNEFYENVCGGIKREFVLKTIEWLYKNKIHTEITNLIVPSYNDKEKDFEETAKFVYSLSSLIPLHFTRFYPMNKLNYLPQTPIEKIFKAKEIAEKTGLKYVYAGNIAEEENTFCRFCKNLLVKRIFNSAEIVGMSKGVCNKCGKKTDFVV